MSMGKEETRQDPITEVEVTRIWYKNAFGVRAVAVKYADPFGGGVEKLSSEDAPIYVALGGRQPEPLVEVLQELERYRSAEATKEKVESTRLYNLTNWVERLDDDLRAIKTRKPWYKRLFKR